MRMTVVLIALVLLGGIGLPGTPGVRAQEAPDPSECQVEPREAAWIAGLAATPIVAVASPAATAATPVPADALPAGEPAGPDALFGINDTMRLVVACVNAGDLPRALALLSDGASRETVEVLFGAAVVTGPASDATPSPLPVDERLPFYSIRDPRVLEDGRVGAIVSDDARPDAAYFIVFIEVDGRWLIDEAFATEAGGAAGP